MTPSTSAPSVASITVPTPPVIATLPTTPTTTCNSMPFAVLARIDGAEAREPQHACKARNRAREQKAGRKRIIHAAIHANARKTRGFGVRADCVMLASAAILLQIHGQRDQHEIRHAEQRAGGDRCERIGQAHRVDLSAMNPCVIRAAHDVDRASTTCRPEKARVRMSPARRSPRQWRLRFRCPRASICGKAADRIRAHVDHGRDRQIDMPHQHHDRHACREQADDRHIE